MVSYTHKNHLLLGGDFLRLFSFFGYFLDSLVKILQLVLENRNCIPKFLAIFANTTVGNGKVLITVLGRFDVKKVSFAACL
jgi:hypothetical protein